MPPEIVEQLMLLVSLALGRNVGLKEEPAEINKELRKLLQEKTK